MRFHRTTAALAAALLLGSLAGCADYTTTGLPDGEAAENEAENAMEGEALAGTSWILTGSTLTEKEIPDAGITADFFEEQMSGSGPVNSYFADYTVEGESIEIGPIGSTMMAGSPGLMAAETAYFALLGKVDSYELAADKLVLKAAGVDVLDYVPASQAGSSTDVQAGAGTQDINVVAESLIGMSVADAEAAATEAGFAFRVTSTDGKPAAVTMDYRTDRINAEVEDDEVVRVTIG